ncbi:MAG: hypothetical protein KGV50_02230 [Gammaproteobacteria bacterium]|nr:hypothetical protein [Gammaproteobacteria bacterium]
MKYNADIKTLDDFYDTIYSIPPRLTREHCTPRTVTQKLLTIFGGPQLKMRSVLITGSKGKGSAALMLSGLLRSSGSDVGVFSSPHLFDYRERIVVDGRMIDQLSLLNIARRVFAAANDLVIEHPDEFPRFFEITTVIAYIYFYENNVDYAVIESGIGALTDATNQDSHCLSVLTNIEGEHLNVFGDLQALAQEKSGVMRENIPLILGDLPEEIDQLIINNAAELNVPVVRFKNTYLKNNRGFYPLAIGEQVWITDSKSKAKNAWIALQAFNGLGEDLTDEEKVESLNQTKLPAREEIVSKTPLVIVDSAHTEASALSLANYVKKSVNPPIDKMVLLVSFSAQKNIKAVLQAFPNVDKIVITQATEDRSLMPQDVEKHIEDLGIYSCIPKIKIIQNPLTALQKTMKKLKKDDVLVITGSVYLAGLISQQFP